MESSVSWIPGSVCRLTRVVWGWWKGCRRHRCTNVHISECIWFRRRTTSNATAIAIRRKSRLFGRRNPLQLLSMVCCVCYLAKQLSADTDCSIRMKIHSRNYTFDVVIHPYSQQSTVVYLELERAL